MTQAVAATVAAAVTSPNTSVGVAFTAPGAYTVHKCLADAYVLLEQYGLEREWLTLACCAVHISRGVGTCGAGVGQHNRSRAGQGK